MNYQEALSWIEESKKYGSVLGLTTIKELLDRLGNPEKKLRFIHIAGTNGKGSTGAFISSILAEEGYVIGRYISPIVFDYREKIQIQMKHSSHYISEEEITSAIRKIVSAVNQMCLDGFAHPTVFEIETAMAFLEFVDHKCDYVVLEVGLGGRYDATNVIQNVICAVITSISMDHMNFLGDSLEKITYEKAGIIKEGCKVVAYDQNWNSDYPERKRHLNNGKDPNTVIREVSNEMGAVCEFTDFMQIKDVSHSLSGITFHYRNFSNLHISLLGDCQVYNAVLAIDAIRALGICKEDSIRKGLECTRWNGRFEMVSSSPLIIIDGAHNEGAARSLEKSIQTYLSGKRLVFVVGVLADKEYDTILKYTAHYAEYIITVTPTDHERALDSAILKEKALQYCDNVVDGQTIQKGLELALQMKGIDGILVFGSLSFLGEVKERLFN